MQRYSEQELYALRDKYQNDLSRMQDDYNKPIPTDASYHKSIEQQKYHLMRDIQTTESSLYSINQIISNIQGTTPEERNNSLNMYYDTKEQEHKDYLQGLRDKQDQEREEQLKRDRIRWAQEDQAKIMNHKKKYINTPHGRYKNNPQTYPTFSTDDLYCTRFMPKTIADEIRSFNSTYQKFLWDPYVKRWHMMFSSTNHEVKFNGYDKYKEYFCNPQQNALAKEWSSTIKYEQTQPETPECRPLTLKVHGKLSI